MVMSLLLFCAPTPLTVLWLKLAMDSANRRVILARLSLYICHTVDLATRPLRTWVAAGAEEKLVLRSDAGCRLAGPLSEVDRRRIGKMANDDGVRRRDEPIKRPSPLLF